MPADAVATWLAGRSTRSPSRVPTCLLGAYASHLTVVESCRVLRNQPLPVAWTEASADFHSCVLGLLFTERGWHQTAFGRAHKAFHAVLPLYATHPERWQEGAEAFHATMARAIATRPREVGCKVPSTRRRMSKSCGCDDVPEASRPQRAAAR
jgi:hypothetical protein